MHVILLAHTLVPPHSHALAAGMNLLGVPVALLDVGVIHFVKMAAELDLGSDGLSKAEFRILVLHLISPTSTDMRENILELLGAVNVSVSATLRMYAPAAHKTSPHQLASAPAQRTPQCWPLAVLW